MKKKNNETRPLGPQNRIHSSKLRVSTFQWERKWHNCTLIYMHVHICHNKHSCHYGKYIWAATWDFHQCGMCDQQRLRPACAYAQSDQNLCSSPVDPMSVKLLTKHYLEYLSLKGGCTGPSESTLVKIPYCWKSHVTAHMLIVMRLCKLVTIFSVSIINQGPLSLYHSACHQVWWIPCILLEPFIFRMQPSNGEIWHLSHQKIG